MYILDTSSKQTHMQRQNIMIIKTLNVHDFRQAFIDYNRGEQFTYDALTALFEWLEELAEDTGEPYELETYNNAGELVRTRYAASHGFLGQTIIDTDIVSTTILKGAL